MLTAQELERFRDANPETLDQLIQTPDPSLVRMFAMLDRQAFARIATEATYEAGEFVCHEGDSGDSMYLIWSGQAAVFKGSLNAPTILGYRGPGETLGEMALLDGQPRSASIVALEPLRLLNINRESFHNWLSSVPAMGMSIMSALSRRLRAADNVRTVDSRVEQQLTGQVNRLMTEKEQLIELQRVREETSNLVVHDLRNPLSIIMGALSMLELVLPEEVLGANRELIDLMESSMERMQRLVDSLLDVARLESGELPLNVMACNLKPIIEEIGRRVQMQSQLREVTVCMNAPDNLPLVVVDVEKMDRVLANLMDNALKYTPSGGRVTLAAEGYNDAVVIRITDTGPGIPPADRERIFERFAQVKGDQVAHGRRGFGLGLTFCKLTIEAHGGQIWVEDGSDGVGSQFVFTLPLG